MNTDLFQFCGHCWVFQFCWHIERSTFTASSHCFTPSLCYDHWGMLSYLSLLFFGNLHSNRYSFPFLLCFSLLFFSQLFVSPLQTAILLFCISFLRGWSPYGPIWSPYRWVALLKEIPWCLSGKESACQCRRTGLFPGSRDPLEKEMAAHSTVVGTCLVAQMVRNLECRRPEFDPWVGKIPWRR